MLYRRPWETTPHGGDIVLESSTAAWTALAHRVNTAPGPL